MTKIRGRILREMGFVSGCQGIIDRYINVDGAWTEHLNNTKNFILKAAAGKKIGNLAVLGSGWLLDLPVDELAGCAKHVWLYDAVHPSQILHRIGKYGNVTAVEADITGGAITNVWNAVRNYRRTKQIPNAEELCGGRFVPETQPDYVISLNILSQIGVMVTNYLHEHIPADQSETDQIHYLLQKAHLEMLLMQKSCLISDVTEKNYDSTGNLCQETDLIRIELPSSGRTENWEWKFDPVGGYNAGKQTIMKVLAMEF